jgi:hypothetical protein
MRSISIAVLFCVAGFAQQPQATPETYIEKGKIDLAISGSVVIPHSTPGSTTGNAYVDAGYYVSGHSLVGGEVYISASSGAQAYRLGGHYRYLFHTRNPRLFPFLGGSPGFSVSHARLGALSATGTAFSMLGEGGVKWFVVRNVAFEAAYHLQIFHSASSATSSGSSLVFGLAFTF